MLKKDKKIKLNLGCGETNLPGYINVDLENYPHVHYQRSVDDLSIFPDNSAKLIYASHVLGYFNRFEIKNVLNEWIRVLAPDGTLRIAVVDFKTILKIYRQSHDLSSIVGYISARDTVNGKNIYRRCIYDLKYLSTVLKEAGFVRIKKYDWRKTILKNYHDSSQAAYFLDPEHSIPISLNIECKKPRKTVKLSNLAVLILSYLTFSDIITSINMELLF